VRIILCLNCLDENARPFSIGPTKGPQMDTYRDQVDLCNTCSSALVRGDFSTLCARYRSERTIKVGKQS
jgi:hypothetical protein